MNEKIKNNIENILTNMNNIFLDEENRDDFKKLDIERYDENLITSQLLAFHLQFRTLTNKDIDLIDFIGILNRLTIQFLMESQEVEIYERIQREKG